MKEFFTTAVLESRGTSLEFKRLRVTALSKVSSDSFKSAKLKLTLSSERRMRTFSNSFPSIQPEREPAQLSDTQTTPTWSESLSREHLKSSLRTASHTSTRTESKET